ncbi:chemotaxis protein CheA [Sphingomonas glacialis]|uniref:Chemotaxis protein CheA n=1 Tax=Sphingomonas glacialis TaxID=658225 RepID=A0A502FHX9_9SPHN|nr:chemotaxis protein CheW [Sphingomonas glacialis]TPG49097.1 chemotaxis protein CheA [Sphingomonas glacialis]
MDDLLQEFIAETRETLEALSGEIVAWESAPGDRDRLDAIFRFVHTVKGSCGFLDLPRLARLSHAAEDVLAAVRAGERTPDTALVNAVLAIVDRIGELVEAIDAGHAVDDSGEDLLVAALDTGAQAAAPVNVVTPNRAASRSVRLNVDLLDRMMSGMSDMVLARNELARRLRDDGADPSVEAALERLSLTVAEMRDTVTRTRMQKIDALFSALPRMVRDTAAELGKSVTLHIEGSDVELDREMIEMMRDPLVHIIRNSIDHGIEPPALRRLAKKRENGWLNVSARQSGNQIIIEICDDGRGIDVDALIAKIAQEGRRSEAELRALSMQAKLDLIFEPGLSTKEVVTAISGRGVGMDVVRANVEQIGGRIELFNTPGLGLRIAIHVPLTLSIMSTIGVGVRDQRFAISRQAIEEIVRVGGQTIRIDRIGDTLTATVRDRRMPLIDLGGLLGFAPHDPAMLVIVSVSGGSYALAVDGVLDHEELVIKPAAPAIMATGIYAGQTLPDSGLPMLMLDCAGIAQVAGLVFTRASAAEEEAVVEVVPGVQALLFEDLDGCRRIVPLSVIDRVEPVAAGAIRLSAGRLRLSVEGAIIPLVALGEWAALPTVSVLRLRDGATEIAYAIKDALDIVELPSAIVPAQEVGPIAGVVALDGEQIEVLDLFWIFSTHGASPLEAEAPLCLLDGAESAWMTTFLKPVLEASGYRVTATLRPGEVPQVLVRMEGDVAPSASAIPVVRLRRDAEGGGEDTIFRYDRPAVLAAVARSAGGR